METPKVIFETPKGVADDVYMYQLNYLATLLNRSNEDTPEPIDFIKVTGTIQRDCEERFLLGSEIGLNKDYLLDPQTVSRMLADRIEEIGENDETTVKAMSHFTGLTIFTYSGQEYSLTGHIAPVHTGLKWVVSSVCNLDSTVELNDQSRRRIEQALGHHATVSSLLANVLLEENDWAPYDGPSYFKFGIVADEDEIEDDTQTAIALPAVKNPEIHIKERSNLDQFVGVDNIIEELRDVVRLANIPDSERLDYRIELNQAIILHGPSGVAKTEIMRALAIELDAKPTVVKLEALVKEPHVGKWAQQLGDIFNSAYVDTSCRHLLIFDEFDGLIRSGNTDVNGNITNVLKNQLEEMKDYPHVFFIAATNNLADIDAAILAEKRIPVKLSLGLPNDAERDLILRKFIAADTISVETAGSIADSSEEVESHFNKVNTIDFKELVALTDGFSGGDIRMIVQRINKKKLLSRSNPSVKLDIPTHDELIAAIDYMRKHKT